MSTPGGTEGSDGTDSFNRGPDENPIQRGDEEQIILPQSSPPCQVSGFLTFPLHFMPLCFWCASAHGDGVFPITHSPANGTSGAETLLSPINERAQPGLTERLEVFVPGA